MSQGPCAVCGILADQKCARCHAVNYCGQEHQKKDWPNHRATSCLAYVIKSNIQGRRHVFAARNIKKGEMIVNEIPLAASPFMDCCPGCFTPFQIMKPVPCPGCMWPVCGRKCPGLSDPKFHGEECNILNKIKSHYICPNFEALLPLRCLLLKKTDPAKWKVLQEMASQVEAVPMRHLKGESGIFLEGAILEPLASAAPHLLPPDYSPGLLESVLKTVDFYSLCFFRAHTAHLHGICSISSYMSHSCLPNTRFIVKDPQKEGGKLSPCRLLVQAAVDIPKGSKLSTCIIDNRIPTVMRQRDVMWFRDDTCSCDRCLDPRELGTDLGTLRCRNCPGWTYAVNEAFYECEECHSRLSTYAVQEMYECYKTAFLKHEFLEESETWNHMSQVKKKAELLCHPNHSIMLMINLGLITHPRVQNLTSTLTDDEIDQLAETSRQTLKLMLKPFLIERMTFQISRTLYSLEKLNIEIVKRKKLLKKTNARGEERIQQHCRELRRLSILFFKMEYSQSDVESLLANKALLSPLSLPNEKK